MNATENKIPKYVVVTSSDTNKGGWGNYARVAIIETDGVHMPTRIAERDKTCVQIVKTWNKVHVGSTERCQYQRVLKTAEHEAEQMNKAIQ